MKIEIEEAIKLYCMRIQNMYPMLWECDNLKEGTKNFENHIKLMTTMLKGEGETDRLAIDKAQAIISLYAFSLSISELNNEEISLLCDKIIESAKELKGALKNV